MKPQRRPLVGSAVRDRSRSSRSRTSARAGRPGALGGLSAGAIPGAVARSSHRLRAAAPHPMPARSRELPARENSSKLGLSQTPPGQTDPLPAPVTTPAFAVPEPCDRAPVTVSARRDGGVASSTALCGVCAARAGRRPGGRRAHSEAVALSTEPELGSLFRVSAEPPTDGRARPVIQGRLLTHLRGCNPRHPFPLTG